MSSQSSVGSEDSAAPPSVDRQDSDQLKHSQQFRQKQSSIQSQGNPPLAEDESGFFADSVSNSKTVLRAALSCSTASPGRNSSSNNNTQQELNESPPPSARRTSRKSDASLLGVVLINRQKASVASWGSPATAGQEMRAQREADNLDNRGLGIDEVPRPKTAISNIIQIQQQHKASVFSWSSQCSANSVTSSEYNEDSLIFTNNNICDLNKRKDEDFNNNMKKDEINEIKIKEEFKATPEQKEEILENKNIANNNSG
uniref:Uncharacterized protein n=1 Tax=Meloidogyne hapla TaxID=6305 RepID=A0A1I8BPS3_MELHA